MLSSATMEGIISSEMEGLARGRTLLRAKTKLLSARNTIGVQSTESILSTNI